MKWVRNQESGIRIQGCLASGRSFGLRAASGLFGDRMACGIVVGGKRRHRRRTGRSLSAAGGGRRSCKRGRAVYAQHCINCHGSTAKGTERGPDLIRSPLVLRDRLGTASGRRCGKRASHQATLTEAQIVDLSHFLRQRIESVATNRTARAPINVLTGDPEAGRAYLQRRRQAAARVTRLPETWRASRERIPDAVTLQQRWLFPSLPRGGRSRWRSTVTPARAVACPERWCGIDDFTVALREASGEYHGLSRAGPASTVSVQRSATGPPRTARSLHATTTSTT